jgi:transposase
MVNKKAKPYPIEFKESAVKLAIESTNPIAQTAKELGINVNTIHTWIGRLCCMNNQTIKISDQLI